jgi:hypothetical protein
MGYYAKLRLEDDDSNEVYKTEGVAEKVLASGLNYIQRKGDKASAFMNFASYLHDDFHILARNLERAGDKIIVAMNGKKDE